MDNIIKILPIVSIFLTGMYFPVGKPLIRPVFQPPNWVFGTVWTYIALTLGYVTYNILNEKTKYNVRKNILILYFTILLMLNGWLVLNYYNLYSESFWLLVISCFISIIYVVYLKSLNNNSSNLVWLLLPLPFWLVLASCLNGVTYDYSTRKI